MPALLGFTNAAANLGLCAGHTDYPFYVPEKRLQVTHAEGKVRPQRSRGGASGTALPTWDEVGWVGGAASCECESTSGVSSYLAAEGQSHAISGKPPLKHKQQRPGTQGNPLVRICQVDCIFSSVAGGVLP